MIWEANDLILFQQESKQAHFIGGEYLKLHSGITLINNRPLVPNSEGETLKIISFNINSIRARLHQLAALIEKHQPDVIGLQETKVLDDSFPMKAVQELGYHAEIFGQKAHYGVALLSKKPPLKVLKGFAGDDPKDQRRLIGATYEDSQGNEIHVLNGYFPQGESREHPVKFPAKAKFYRDLLQHLETVHKPEDHLVVMGDFNIAPENIDIGIGDNNAKRWLRTGKSSFLPEEREWFKRIVDWGLSDSYRKLFPEIFDQYSWFDYRSRGFEADPKRGLRIDMIMATKPLLELVDDAGIDYELRGMEKPSDHAPIWTHFQI